MIAKDDNEAWFTEADLPFSPKDVKLSVRVSKIIYDAQSEFGHIQIMDTPFFGRILVIDGIINIADRTEFIYHEMMVYLPSIVHGSPKKVLIVGGGDGGAAKHALNIKTVERIVQVEVDKTVVDVCRKYMPSLAEGSLSDSRVELIIGDGMEYVAKSDNKFDVIVLDVSDPVPGGPAENLLSKKFYQDVKHCLNPGGVVLTHCGSLIFQAEKAHIIVDSLKESFKHVQMHVALIPEFELTEFGFLVCTDDPIQLNHDVVQTRFQQLVGSGWQYLSPDVYFSSKVLPPYIQQLTGIRNRD